MAKKVNKKNTVKPEIKEVKKGTKKNVKAADKSVKETKTNVKVANKQVKETKNNINKKVADENIVSTNNNDVKKIVILILIIIATFILFYIMTNILNKKKYDDIFKKDSLGSAEIQYDEILVGTILNQNPKTYYVLATVSDDENLATYDSIVEQYEYYKYDYKIYKVNLSSAFNKNSLADIKHFDEDKLKFKGTTLLKIKNKKINKVYEDPDDIEEVLEDLLSDAKDND